MSSQSTSNRAEPPGSNAVIFEELAEEFGGALDPSTMPEGERLLMESLLAGMRKRLQSSIDQRTPGPVRKPTLVGLLKSLEVNALAASFPQADFVGINAGAVLYVYYLAKEMLAHPDLFVHIGDSRQESAAGRSNPNRALREPDWLAASWSARAPRDSNRRAYANFLASQGIQFIFLHELGHIEHGHVDWQMKLTGLRALEENANEPARHMSGLDRQTLELDADCYAAYQSVGQIFSSQFATTISLMAREPAPFEDAAYLWAAGTQMFFRAVGSDDVGERPFHHSHPPARYRQTFIVPTGLEYIERFHPRHKLQYGHATAYASVEVERAWGVLTGRRFDVKLIENGGYLMPDYWSKAVDYTAILLANWKKLRPQLEPLVRRGILPD